MFKKMQIKLTIFFTLMLMLLLLGTNLTLYFVLTSYNNSQIVLETNRMLESISGSEWVQEDAGEEEYNLIEGVPEEGYDEKEDFEDDEKDRDEIDDSDDDEKDHDEIDDSEDDEKDHDKIDDSDDDEKDHDEIDDSDDDEKDHDEIDDSEDDEKDRDEIDDSDDDEKDRDEIDDSDDDEKERDEIDDSEDDSALNNNSVILLGSVSTEPLNITKLKTLGKDDVEVNNEENEISFNGSNELVIPRALDAFSFYFIYDVNGELLKWKNDFNSLTMILFEESKNLTLGGEPKVLIIGDENDQSFLIRKSPIIIDNEMVGYYTVGRDISIANQTLDNLLYILIISLVIGVVISVVFGYVIAGKMMRPIKEAYLSKQSFLADASHELRTPISVVLLSCDTLKGEALENDPFSKQIIDGIRDEAFVMKGLVERLLSLARYDTSSIKYEKKIIDLSEVIQDNIKSYQYLNQQESVEIVDQVENGLMVLGDKGLLHSLISILIDNAIKYNKSNGKVTVTGEIIYLKKKSFIQLKVEDTGKGIKAEDLVNIFNRFYRADKSRTKDVNGHGLGLSIAKEVVSLHKGDIDVISEVGVGTTFTVKLPVLK